MQIVNMSRRAMLGGTAAATLAGAAIPAKASPVPEPVKGVYTHIDGTKWRVRSHDPENALCHFPGGVTLLSLEPLDASTPISSGCKL